MFFIRKFGLFLFLCIQGCVQAAPDIQVARLPEGAMQPQVVAKNGVVHLVFLKGEPRACDVWYQHSNDWGKVWSAPLRVNSQTGSAVAMGTIRGAQLAVGRNGRVFVAWNGSGEAQPRNAWTPESAKKHGASPYLFSRLKDDGSAFEAQRNLMTKTFNLDGGGSLAADDEGRVYVVWHANDKAGQDEDGRHVWIARSTDDGATFTKETPAWNEPTGVCGCCQLKLMAENDGKVTLLFRAATEMVNRDTFALFSTDSGKSFNGKKIHDWKINACPMSSYALDKFGDTTLAAWESDQRVFYSPLSDAMQATRIVEAPGKGDNRKHPALAVDGEGQTLLVWDENTAWGRGGKILWQLYDKNGRPVANASGQRNGLPVWSYAATFARPDGGFTILY
jgi:hypothetical protein